jgi:hypothetical protein
MDEKSTVPSGFENPKLNDLTTPCEVENENNIIILYYIYIYKVINRNKTRREINHKNIYVTWRTLATDPTAMDEKSTVPSSFGNPKLNDLMTPYEVENEYIYIYIYIYIVSILCLLYSG